MKSPSYQPPPSSSKPASVLPHKTPKLRDHYRIGKKLGQGQFGTTYLCIDKSDGKEYACKSMPKRKLICREDCEDVWREIQILHHLSEHPNVVRIKGAYEDAVFVHLVMELAAGGELFDRIIQDGHYSERKAAELIKTIVGVVEACHSLGVMHRDLKPENFLFASTDEDAALKATDFRLSVFYKPGDIFSDVVGSPYYVAPEVLHKYYGPEADVWSSGVILYILLSGIPPFWAETEAGIFRQILQGPLDFESEPWPCISDSAKDLIRNMLNRDPKKRFTAHQVLSHPWIVDAGVAPDKPLDSAVLSRLKQFSAMNKLKKMALRGDQSERPPHYKHIERNEFSYRKHVKQKEEDIAICVCQYDTNDPDSACGERCLNVLTSTECTPGYCPCGNYCRNQKFQKCEYAKSRLFRTEGRGWGLLADENIKAGMFIIEYCGVVISSKEAKRRSQTYETAGLQDAYIIFLNAQESIDATRKGNLARFINHSCQPNCETRKWNVLGEVRVGIFAKHDIPIGTELAYDYNFEWYGGAKVRCLCGADCCSGFLGAKSRGFQEATHVWEDGDDRYSVEDIPIYNSEDDEPTSQLFQAIVPSKVDSASVRESEIFIYNADGHESLMFSDSNPFSVEPLNSVPMDMDGGKFGKRKENSFYPHDAQQKLKQKSSLMSHIRSNSACRNYQIQSNSVAKNSLQYSGGKSKNRARKEFSVTQIGECLLSKDARDDLLAHEEAKNLARSRLDSLYDEIRPAIEEHERDSQESVPTSVAERWIEASCSKLKAELDLSVSLIKSILGNHRRPRDDANSGDGLKYLENGQ